MSFDAVLFDLDDTLYARRAAGQARAQWFAETQLNVSGDEAREAAALIVELDNGGYGDKPAMFAALRQRFPHLTHDDDTLRALFIDRILESLTLPAETHRVLDALDAAQIPFGIVTNGPPTQARKLEMLGIAPLAACVFVSDTFGHAKPARAIFDAAAQNLGVPPERILFVGDHAKNDIVGAAGAGMKTAWLSNGQEWPKELNVTPDFTLGGIEDVTAILGLQPGISMPGSKQNNA